MAAILALPGAIPLSIIYYITKKGEGEDKDKK
jgi:hypothetical protein